MSAIPFVFTFIRTDVSIIHIQITDYEANRLTSSQHTKRRGRAIRDSIIGACISRRVFLSKCVCGPFSCLPDFPQHARVYKKNRQYFSFVHRFLMNFPCYLFRSAPIAVFCPTRDFLASSPVGIDLATALRYVLLFLTRA